MNREARINLRDYWPSVAEKAIDIYEQGDFELVVKCNDGTAILYDDFDKTVRKLPSDSRAMTDEEYHREFRMRLRKIMHRKNINQRELSEITGISQVSISNYINGRTNPSFYAVDKIAKALGCSMEDLRYTY